MEFDLIANTEIVNLNLLPFYALGVVVVGFVALGFITVSRTWVGFTVGCAILVGAVAAIAVFGLQTYERYQNPEGNTHNEEEVISWASSEYDVVVSSTQASLLLNDVDSNDAPDGRYGAVNVSVNGSEPTEVTLIRSEGDWKLVTYSSSSEWVELEMKP